MIKNIISPIIHIMMNAGRFYRSLFIRPSHKVVFVKHAPGSLEDPLVRHRDYDLEGVWDE